MKKILLIATGGTIASHSGKEGLGLLVEDILLFSALENLCREHRGEGERGER